MLLPAETPRDFLDGPYARFFRPHFEEASPERPHRVLSLAEIVADDAAALRAVHDGLTGRGSPPPAASTYLAGWFGGIAAAVTAYAMAAGAGAAFLPRDGGIAWYFHPAGWTDRVALAEPEVLVPDGHPWTGRPDVTVVADDAERHRRTVDALVTAVEPIIAALTRLAKVSRTNLWHEVADGFASALVYQAQIPVTPEGMAEVRALIAVPGAPWRRKPVIERIATDWGAVCAMHKAGCCLAYTEPHHADGGEEHDHDHDHEEDDDHRLFHQLFPDPPGAPAYCANCRLRPIEDCFERQLWWRNREHQHRVAAGAPDPLSTVPDAAALG
ncbi:MAG: hypothetical protein KIS96_05565 [Bauldia sp.]|nr:hypothetical protein [Bauldia sp.]